MVKKTLKLITIIDYIQDCDKWSLHKLIPTKLYCRKIIKTTIQEFDELRKIKKIEVSIFFSNNKNIQEFNKKYLNKDKPTNVLSFPSHPNLLLNKINDHYIHLGDIILAIETILNECETLKKNFMNHLSHLIVHGVLHLLGLDHEIEKEYLYMKSKEIKILNQLGIDSPYE